MKNEAGLLIRYGFFPPPVLTCVFTFEFSIQWFAIFTILIYDDSYNDFSPCAFPVRFHVRTYLWIAPCSFPCAFTCESFLVRSHMCTCLWIVPCQFPCAYSPLDRSLSVPMCKLVSESFLVSSHVQTCLWIVPCQFPCAYLPVNRSLSVPICVPTCESLPVLSHVLTFGSFFVFDDAVIFVLLVLRCASFRGQPPGGGVWEPRWSAESTVIVVVRAHACEGQKHTDDWEHLTIIRQSDEFGSDGIGQQWRRPKPREIRGFEKCNFLSGFWKLIFQERKNHRSIQIFGSVNRKSSICYSVLRSRAHIESIFLTWPFFSHLCPSFTRW